MIVTCGHCNTQFQLDDAKIPPAGVRVRCSRCSHTFAVESPQRPDGDRAAELARDAFDPGSLDDSESDWQFNEDVAPAQSDGSAAGWRAAAVAAVDGLLGAGFADSRDSFGPGDSDFELEEADEKPVESSPLAESPGAAWSGFDAEFGAADAAGPFAAFDDLGDLAGDEPDGFEMGEPARNVDSVHAENSSSDPPDFDASDSENGRQDDLEDPRAPTREPKAPVEHAAAPKRREVVAAPAVKAVEPRERVAPTLVDDLELDLEADSVRAWGPRVRSGAGWAFVLSVSAYAAVAGLVPGSSAGPLDDRMRPIAGADLRAVRGRWVENAAAGPIYVVTGDLSVDGADFRSGSKLLRIRLVDASGRPIAAQSVALGPPLPAEHLREWNLRDLQDAQEVAARRMAQQTPADGERRPFVAILGKVPGNSGAFEFVTGEAASTPVAPSGSEIPYPEQGMQQHPRG